MTENASGQAHQEPNTPTTSASADVDAMASSGTPVASDTPVAFGMPVTAEASVPTDAPVSVAPVAVDSTGAFATPAAPTTQATPTIPASQEPPVVGTPGAYGAAGVPTDRWRAMLAAAQRWVPVGQARRRVVSGAAVLALALTGGAVGGAVGYSLHSDAGLALVSSTTSVAPVVDRSSLAGVAADVQPSIVDITTGSAEGSGIVITADGYIVTNNHVIEGARSVAVTLSSGEKVAATVVGTDSAHDLAVLKVDRSGLAHASWADSDGVSVGDTVLALGSPLGLQGTVTSGIVSALHRTITVGEEQSTRYGSGSSTTIDDAIQTDAPINSGNSGGALVNTNGAVIGITSAIATAGSSGNVGVGFAIPSNVAKAVVDAIIAGK
jgi:putative serine protease PepD